MRVANLIVSILSAIAMAAGAVVPIGIGLLLSFEDFIAGMFYGVDGTFPDQVGGFPFLLITSVVVINSLIVFILSIVAAILSKRPYMNACTALYVTNCVFTIFSVAFAVYSSVWLNTREFIPDNMNALYAWPIVGALFAIAMIVLSVLCIVKNKEEDNFREMMEDYRGRNGY